jgi:hypothetical protein
MEKNKRFPTKASKTAFSHEGSLVDRYSLNLRWHIGRPGGAVTAAPKPDDRTNFNSLNFEQQWQGLSKAAVA